MSGAKEAARKTGQRLRRGAVGAANATSWAAKNGVPFAARMTSFGFDGIGNNLAQDQFSAQASAAAAGLDLGMQKTRNGLARSGFSAYGSSLGAEADFEASSAAWDTKNAFATHMAGMAGLHGGNPGSLAPGGKPAEMRQLAGGGVLGSETRNASHYGGFGFMSGVDSMLGKNRSKGSQLYMNQWKPWGTGQAATAGLATGLVQSSQGFEMMSDIGARAMDYMKGNTGGPEDPGVVLSGLTQTPSLENTANNGAQPITPAMIKSTQQAATKLGE